MKGPFDALVFFAVARVGAGQRAQRQQPRHETAIRVRFAGRHQLVHLIGNGEVVPRLGRSGGDRQHRAVRRLTDRNPLAWVALHNSPFSHAPQTGQGRRVEVIGIGAELDMVLRADRMLQLWAAAEPGKVIEGLTIKQEISAIREALNSGDQEFMSQYGGMQGAADRYMELLKLPEAAELPKGVSIDGYSTFRATRTSGRI